MPHHPADDHHISVEEHDGRAPSIARHSSADPATDERARAACALGRALMFLA